MSDNTYTHDAYETIHKSGKFSYVSYIIPNIVKIECEIPAPVKYVVPIIFIPGIMGSNIKYQISNIKDKEVWYPKKSISTVLEYSRRDAMQLQIALNFKTTAVGDDKLNKKKTPHMTKELAKARAGVR